MDDIVISNVDPLDDIAALAQHETTLSHVIQSGQPVVDRTASGPSFTGGVAVRRLG